MVSVVASLHSVAARSPPSCDFTSLSATNKNLRPPLNPNASSTKPSIFCSNVTDSTRKQRICFQERSQITRRETLVPILFAAFSIPSIAVADASSETGLVDNFRIYSDELNKFKITVPQDWLVGAEEANGSRSVTAFYPEEATSSNVSIVITGLGPDFTRLESFGKVDAFAETLVSGLDRSWRSPPGVAAKLIDSKASNGLYYIEYTLQNPGESRRHLFCAIGMSTNGWYNRLYTVTGQFVEEDSEKYRSRIEKAVSSFRLV
eukprot:TRINITY_DN11407_c0_g1_i1.p1 TRINITY_DN11407_c0_g1~~TRINITY_DN11407_c0_g1_i1.p1  ORF type:complete len:262 (-),score=26.57 TRINITY_DN11407_c0_g1_i1:150-935(-)